MRAGPAVQRFVGCFNAGVTGLADSRLVGQVVRRHITTATYTGRRSGRTFHIPVGYRRSDDVVTIGVQIPDRKNWWRNFTGDGGPLTLQLDGADRTGHAVAERDGRQVRVTVRLD
jgi:hypothetical protein